MICPWRFFAFLLFWLGVSAIGRPAEAEELAVTIVGPSDYPPYAFADNGRPTGIFPNIFAEISDRIDGYRIEIHNLPWKRALKSVELGIYIAVFPPYRWPEQRPWMAPYSEPILEETVGVFCRHEVMPHERPDWPGDYYGLTIGLGLGSLAAGPEFFKAAEDGLLTHLPVALEAVIPHLLEAEVDCVVQDTNVLEYHYRQYSRARGLGEPWQDRAKLGAVISKQWAYLGFGPDPDNSFPYRADFLDKVNAAIRAMRAEGRIDAIVASHR